LFPVCYCRRAGAALVQVISVDGLHLSARMIAEAFFSLPGDLARRLVERSFNAIAPLRFFTAKTRLQTSRGFCLGYNGI
jgi:hypothetical protein